MESNKELNTKSYGYIAINNYIDKLFKIEREIAKFDVSKKVEERQKRSKPIVDEFFKWVQDINETKTIINKKLKEAITYTINQKTELSEFLKDGRIPMSNNLVERGIKSFATHRRAWLFSDTPAGAKASAVIYSLVESAKLNKLNIYKYINYLLSELPQLENLNNEAELAKYLPWSKQLPKEILNFQSSEVETDEFEDFNNKLVVEG